MIRRDNDAGSRLVLFLAFAATSALNYVFGLAMGWILLPGDFGLLAFAQTILLVGGLVLQSGFPWSLAREVPVAERDHAGRLIRGALVANTGLGVVLGAAIVLGYMAGPLRSGLETVTIALLVGVSLVPIGSVAAARAAAQGRSRFALVARLHTIEVAAKAALGILLVLLGFGVTGALIGFLVGGLVAAGAGLRDVKVNLAVPLRGPAEMSHIGRAMPTFVVLIGLALLLNMDLLALKLLSDDRAAVGHYQAGFMLANLPYFIVTSAIVPILYVRVAEGVRDALPGALRLAAVLALPIEVLLMVAPAPVLDLVFPAAYSDAADVLPLLAVGNALLMFAAIVAADLVARDRARVAVHVLWPLTLIEVLALALVVPRWGAMGAAVVFAVASGVAVAGCAAPYLARLGRRSGQASYG